MIVDGTGFATPLVDRHGDMTAAGIDTYTAVSRTMAVLAIVEACGPLLDRLARDLDGAISAASDDLSPWEVAPVRSAVLAEARRLGIPEPDGVNLEEDFGRTLTAVSVAALRMLVR